VRASGLWDMELEFLDRRFFNLNYWGKVEKLTVNSFQFTVQWKWLWDKEMGNVMGVKTLEKSCEMEIQ
jgi:hypothetical protein